MRAFRLLVAMVVMSPVIAGAQVSRPRAASAKVTDGLFDVTPYAGYMMFGSFIDGPLGTSISNAPAPVYGAQVGMKVSPILSMIGNIATSSSNIQVGVPFLGGVNLASTSMLFYDAGLQLAIPVTSAYGYAFTPFVQAGVGGMHYKISQSLLTTSATNLAGTFGAGADVGLVNGLGLRLMVKDYVGKFNYEDATSFDFNGKTTNNVSFSAGLRFSF